MKIAITGGAGFVGRNLAALLRSEGHEVVSVSRRDGIDIGDEEQLARAFTGCEGVAHCAGINREIGAQTYGRVHVEGTRNVVNAATRAGVDRLAFVSFLRARPNCGSGYHESKFAAEEIVRGSGLDYTILKAGVIYGKGDHMLGHMSYAFHTVPVFGLVGMKDKPMRPIAVEDMAKVLKGSLVDGRLSRQTVAVVGPEEIPLSEAVRRVARACGKRPWVVPVPLWFHYPMAWTVERIMTVPMVAVAQIMMLSEGLADPLPAGTSVLSGELAPTTPFTDEQIRKGLPAPKGFGFRDLRVFAKASPSHGRPGGTPVA